MTENEIATIVLDICYHIHKELGPGLLESVYEEILCHELGKREIEYSRQKPLPVIWEGKKMEIGFRTEVIVENKVIVEIKSVEAITPVFPKVLLTYLRLSDKKPGLLINFNEVLIKNGIKRIVNGL